MYCGLTRYHVDPSQLLSLGITYQLLHTKGSQAIDVIEDWGPFLWYYNYTYVVWNSFLLLKCYSSIPIILVKITYNLTITTLGLIVLPSSTFNITISLKLYSKYNFLLLIWNQSGISPNFKTDQVIFFNIIGATDTLPLTGCWIHSCYLKALFEGIIWILILALPPMIFSSPLSLIQIHNDASLR